MSFSTNLKAAMAGKRWTPAHLAAAMSDGGFDCHVITIQRYMEGEREPKASTLYAIARALDTTVDALLADAEPAEVA